MLQVQGGLLHQCVPISAVWMSAPHEKAVRGEKGCEAGTERLWAVLHAFQELSDMAAEQCRCNLRDHVFSVTDIYNDRFAEFMEFQNG